MTTRIPVMLNNGTLQQLGSGDTLPVTNLPVMGAASAGAAGLAGLVPAPQAGDQDKILYGDKTWRTPTGGGVADHEALTGIQGGSSGQHYHLYTTQIDGLNAVLPNATAIHALTTTQMAALDANTSIQTQLNGKITNPMTAGGDLICGGAAGTPTRLANGAAGQQLVSGGATNAPVYRTPAYAMALLFG